MLIQKYPIQAEQLPFPEKFFPEDSLFFDIETTGLSHKRSHLYMIGAIYREAGQLTFIQWFLQRPSEEKDVLLAFSTLVRQVSTVIHYNGQTFDVPYIKEKCHHWDLDDPFSADCQIQSLDLYRKMLPLKKVLQMTSLKQKDIENFLHYPRADEKDGKELIQVYQQYLQNAGEEELQLLLLHNRDDLFGMLTIYGFHTALSNLISEESQTTLNVASEEIPESLNETSEDIQAISQNTDVYIEENTLKIRKMLSPAFPADLHIESEYGVLHIENSLLFLTIYGSNGCFRHYFSNYKDYFYLPLEDTAIHKSVGIYVDPSCREKAKADTCYIKKEGLFFFQPTDLFQPDFRMDKRKGPSFFLSEQLEKEPEKINEYSLQIIRYFLNL